MPKHGEYAEGLPWSIKYNQSVDAEYGAALCKHAVDTGITEELADYAGRVYRVSHYFAVPRVVEAFNEAGCNLTRVCVDCILEEIRGALES